MDNLDPASTTPFELLLAVRVVTNEVTTSQDLQPFTDRELFVAMNSEARSLWPRTVLLVEVSVQGAFAICPLEHSRGGTEEADEFDGCQRRETLTVVSRKTRLRSPGGYFLQVDFIYCPVDNLSCCRGTYGVATLKNVPSIAFPRI